MASVRHSKHHARFHAAVLRHFFGSSSPLPNAHQEALKLNQPVDIQVPSPTSTELVIEETHSDNEGEDIGKTLLSRAQRKRLKSKKEKQLNAIPAKKFIGPLLPGVLDIKTLENDDQKSADALLKESVSLGKTHAMPSTRDEQHFDIIQKPEVSRTMAVEELPRCNTEDAMGLCLEMGEDFAVLEKEEATSLHLETEEELSLRKTMEAKSVFLEAEEGKDVHDAVELEAMSKVKRRRLAKKRFHDSSRRPMAGSTFTAEIKGEAIIIKQIS